MDWLSKSDPMVVVYVPARGLSSGRWTELGRTECIKDDLNPKFVKSFLLDYRFNEVQPLRFEVYDIDSKYSLESQDYIGEVETTLGEVAAARSQMLTHEIKYRKPQLVAKKRGYLAAQESAAHEYGPHASAALEEHAGTNPPDALGAEPLDACGARGAARRRAVRAGAPRAGHAVAAAAGPLARPQQGAPRGVSVCVSR